MSDAGRSTLLWPDFGGAGILKMVAEYRRRAMAVETLAESALTREEADQLRKIARAWEVVARMREEYLKMHPEKAVEPR